MLPLKWIARGEKWRVLGLCSKMTKRQAERENEKILREVNQQAYTIQSHVPFEEFLAVYRREHYRSLKESSVRYYEARLSGRIEPALKGRKLYQITPLEIGQLMADMGAAGVARSTRKATRDILANIFEMARRWGVPKRTRIIEPGVWRFGRTDSGTWTIWTPTFDEA